MMTRLMLILTAAFLVMFFAGPSAAQVPDSCDYMMPGDANSDGQRNVGDVLFLVDFFVEGGPTPEPLANGDIDGDCDIDSTDAYNMLMYIFKCKNGDKCGYTPVECTCIEPVIGQFYQDISFGSVPGDVNADGSVQIGDAVYMVSFIFKRGPKPAWYATIRGDANCDCQTDVADAVYIINYVFRGGPAPCSTNELIDDCNIDKARMVFDWMMWH